MRVVVVSWNSREVLPRCLEALRETEWPGPPLELVVIDNGSTDGTTSGWARHQPDVTLRQTGANRGFAAAANVGLADRADLDAVALINPDAFVDPGWLLPLVAALEEDAHIGAAAPKILLAEADAAGRSVINNVGNELGPRWEPHDRGLGEVDRGQYDDPEDVWGWCGGAVLLRREYLDDVGLFDERLFLYAEDVDLSWRGLRRGWRYRYVPTSIVRHVHRASSGGVRTNLLDHLNRRNRLVVVTHHDGLRGATIAWSRALGGIVNAAVVDVAIPVVTRRTADVAGLRRRVRAAWDAARLLLGSDPTIPGVDRGPSDTSP